MTSTEIYNSLPFPKPPAGLSHWQLGLWQMHPDQWDKAHSFAQTILNRDGTWLHTLIHRQEGAHSHAQFGYHLAQRLYLEISVQEELEKITDQTLSA